MFFCIDSSPSDQVKLSLWLNNIWVHGTFSTSEPLLVGIDGFLKEQNVKISDLKGLAVLVGSGRFTSTRIATTTINTLAYVLQIPAIGIREINWKKLPSQISAAPVGQYVAALYSGEANIGGKK